MAFQENPKRIAWRAHLRASPACVYEILSSDHGRARFWAESAAESEGVIHFIFPNGQRWEGKILERRAPEVFSVEYIGGSVARFELADDGKDGTVLTLTDTGVAAAERTEVIAGWVSVLLALKAAVDFDVDLRNHDPHMTWEQGFVEN